MSVILEEEGCKPLVWLHDPEPDYGARFDLRTVCSQTYYTSLMITMYDTQLFYLQYQTRG